MKIFQFILFSLAIAVNIYCTNDTAEKAPARGAQEDSTEIAQLIRDDYATMQTNDTVAHLKNVTADYVLIEHDQVWDLKMEFDSIYRSPVKKTSTRTDHFNFRSIKVYDDFAYAIWLLRSDMVRNGESFSRNWNESGVLRKEDGRWKIALIHSTRIWQK